MKIKYPYKRKKKWNTIYKNGNNVNKIKIKVKNQGGMKRRWKNKTQKPNKPKF